MNEMLLLVVVVVLGVLVVNAVHQELRWRKEGEVTSRHNRGREVKEALGPLQAQLESVRGTVQDFALNTTREQTMIREQLLKVEERSLSLLTTLKGDRLVQGQWGEYQLEGLLQAAGLVRGRHYALQGEGLSLKGPDGRHLKPDVVLFLPEEGRVYIDSKVSLKSFYGFSNAKDKSERRAFLESFVGSLRSHIRSLGSKDYGASSSSSLRETILFFPLEHGLRLALETDHSLLDFARKHKVFLATPFSLMAMLGLLSRMWQQAQGVAYSLKITEEGGKLYDKICIFLEYYGGLGRSLKGAQEAYEKGLKNLAEGKDNVLVKADKLRAMGVKTSKEFPVREKVS